MKEIEDFFTRLKRQSKSNPYINSLINEVLSRKSIQLTNISVANISVGNISNGSPYKQKKEGGSKNLILFNDLDQLSQQISKALTLLLNDPLHHSSLVSKFFTNHQIFEIMPIVEKFRELNPALHDLYKSDLSIENLHDSILKMRQHQLSMSIDVDRKDSVYEEVVNQRIENEEALVIPNDGTSPLQFINFECWCEYVEQKIVL